MNLTTKFNFGDRVWKIGTIPRKEFNKCKFCEGVGEIVGKDGTTRQCPECYGRREYETLVHEGWRIMSELTIGEVKIMARGKDPVGSPFRSQFSNYGPQMAAYEEEYMCKESGIGSGSVHYVDTLWATKEEAQTECDKRNAEDANENKI